MTVCQTLRRRLFYVLMKSPTTVRHLPLASAAMVFAAIFVMRIIQINDPDVFLHIRSGWWIIENRTIPAVDPFTIFAQGQRWVNHQWLAQVAIALAAAPAIGGLVSLSLIRALVIATSYWLVYRAARIRGATNGTALFCIFLGSLVTWTYSEPRPYLVTYLALAWMNLAWSAYKARGSRAIYALPVVMLIWANSHGGATSGLLLLGAWVAGEMIISARNKTMRPVWLLLALLLLTLLASFVSPHGWRIVLFPFKIVGQELLETRIFEWNAPAATFDFQLFWLYLALFGFVCLMRWRTLSPGDAIASAGFIYMSLTARRHIPLMIYVTAPILAWQITELKNWRLAGRKGRSLPPSFHQYVMPLVAALIVIFGVVWSMQMVAGRYIAMGLGLNPWIHPKKAVDFIQSSPLKPQLFNDYNSGGYLIYRLRKPWKAFIDGRVDIYGPKGVERYTRMMAGKDDWEKSFSKYNINTVMLDYLTISRLPYLERQLWESPEWALVYWDDLSLIYVREETIPEEFIKQHAYKQINPTWPASEVTKAISANTDAANAELQRTIRDNPWNLRAMNFLSAWRAKDGHIDEAEALCRRILELEPRFVQARYRLAQILDKKQQLDEAEKQYRLYLKLEPGNVAAIIRLGTIAERRGETKKALRFYEDALEIAPSDAGAMENAQRARAKLKP